MNAMKCEDVEARIIDYLDKKLGEEESRAIESHIEKCERCLDDLNETQKLLSSMAGSEMEIPDESLRINFYSMLQKEAGKNKTKYISTGNIPSKGRFPRIILSIAAGAALLICGSLVGAFITAGIKNSQSVKDLAQLKTEVEQLKRTAMFTMLKEESSSYRIQAVNYADDMKNPDEKVIAVLLNTLNHDKNVNVRMAAAYALAKYADQKTVSDSLVESLSAQVDPILQVTLINILVERNEKGAIRPMQQIISNSGTLKEVKAVAEKGIKTLL
jgi:hypothetical protein